MKTKKTFAALLFCFFIAWGPAASAGHAETALRWAPVIYGQNKSTAPTAQDNVFTLVNYDHDWRSNNNWQNLPFYPPAMTVYYSLVESETHYYLGYYLYFPRHAGAAGKEHYLAGMLAAVRKEAGGAERLEGVVTYSDKRWRWWEEPDVRQENGRFLVAVSAVSHDLRVIGRNRRPPELASYSPLGTGEDERSGRRINQMWSHGGYRLVPLDDLWEIRNDIGPGRLFSRWGYLDSASAETAAMPWVWEYRKTNLLARPGELVGLLQQSSDASAPYIYNPYI